MIPIKQAQCDKAYSQGVTSASDNGGIMAKVLERDFEWQDHKLVHVPTQATFELGLHEDTCCVNWGQADDVLNDGRDYDRDELIAAARRIILAAVP
jgi:hypothetical protein